MKEITKEQAIEICREQLLKYAVEGIRSWEPEYFTDEPPNGAYLAQEAENGCWFLPFPKFGPQPMRTGGGLVVGISKKTGKIVFSGNVGE